MALRTILTWPDPLLTRVSKKIETFDEELRTLAEDMVETMRAAPGIGLAAPQVGVLKRLIVVEVAPERDGEETEELPTLYTVCNPVITKKEGEAKIEEGCLSVPGLYVEVDRAERVRIEGQAIDGKPFALDAEGLLAICFQHEIEHLNGRLLVHYVSTVKRELYRREIRRKRETPLKESSDEGRRAL